LLTPLSNQKNLAHSDMRYGFTLPDQHKIPESKAKNDAMHAIILAESLTSMPCSILSIMRCMIIHPSILVLRLVMVAVIEKLDLMFTI